MSHIMRDFSSVLSFCNCRKFFLCKCRHFGKYKPFSYQIIIRLVCQVSLLKTLDFYLWLILYSCDWIWGYLSGCRPPKFLIQISIFLLLLGKPCSFSAFPHHFNRSCPPSKDHFQISAEISSPSSSGSSQGPPHHFPKAYIHWPKIHLLALTFQLFLGSFLIIEKKYIQRCITLNRVYMITP